MAAVIKKFPNWSASDRQNTLTGRLYNGMLGFTVFPRDRNAGREPLLRISFDKDGVGIEGLLELIDKIGKAPLGQKMQMSRTQFDPQTKTRNTQWVLALEKDNDMCYFITITDVAKNATYRFPITTSQSILVGAEPPTKSDLSSRGMRLFKKWLLRAEQDAPFTIDPDAQFGGKGGSRPAGGGYGGAPRTPTAAAVAPSVSSDAEDVPF